MKQSEEIQRINRSLMRQCRTIGLIFVISTGVAYFWYNQNILAFLGIMVIFIPLHLLAIIVNFIIHIRKLNKLSK